MLDEPSIIKTGLGVYTGLPVSTKMKYGQLDGLLISGVLTLKVNIKKNKVSDVALKSNGALLCNESVQGME